MPEYALRLSDNERARYRLMAERAREQESQHWTDAGLVAGARVVDLGCGPGAVLAVMAEIVGTDGSVIGVDGDPDAVAAAQEAIDTAGLDHASVRHADVASSGLEPASADVVMVRHVLAHNGPTEQDIVDHAASLITPGGCVFLVDVDYTYVRLRPPHPVWDEMGERYLAFQNSRGNDLQTGVRLGTLLERADLEVGCHVGEVSIYPWVTGLRPPPYTARESLRAAGFVDDADLARWDAAVADLDACTQPPMLHVLAYRAFGRRGR
ncbi:MAG: class I SAM-dependent methyltransferase [Sporichthyaceae bacterium]